MYPGSNSKHLSDNSLSSEGKSENKVYTFLLLFSSCR